MSYKNSHGNEIKQKFCLIFMFDYFFVIFGHRLCTSSKKKSKTKHSFYLKTPIHFHIQPDHTR